MRRLRRHPSQSQLAAWLETGGPDEVTAHVDQCDRCANTLERIAEGGESETKGAPSRASVGTNGGVVGSRIAQALSSMWEAPADLQSRVIERVDSRIRAESDFAVLAGLFTIGVETAQLMIPGQPRGNPPQQSPHHAQQQVQSQNQPRPPSKGQDEGEQES